MVASGNVTKIAFWSVTPLFKFTHKFVSTYTNTAFLAFSTFASRDNQCWYEFHADAIMRKWRVSESNRGLIRWRDDTITQACACTEWIRPVHSGKGERISAIFGLPADPWVRWFHLHVGVQKEDAYRSVPAVLVPPSPSTQEVSDHNTVPPCYGAVLWYGWTRAGIAQRRMSDSLGAPLQWDGKNTRERSTMERDVNALAIAEHVWNEHHRMDWSVVEVVDTEQYLCPRLLLELWHIHSEQNPMNRERGSLPTEYCSLIKKSWWFLYYLYTTPIFIPRMRTHALLYHLVTLLTPYCSHLFFIPWWWHLHRRRSVGIHINTDCHS